MPSPLKSPTASQTGRAPAPRYVSVLAGTAVNPPEPFPKKIVMLLLTTFAVARSGMPSPLKSPTMIEAGPDPGALNGLPEAAVNPPDPFPSNTVMLLLVSFAVARS